LSGMSEGSNQSLERQPLNRACTPHMMTSTLSFDASGERPV
jgi:hypothetical protein